MTVKTTPPVEETEATLEATAAEVRAKFRKEMDTQMVKALDVFNADKIVREIVTDMRKHQQDLVMRVIGMENRYGKWEVDHCNGRMSNITEFVNTTCKQMLEEELRAMLKEEIEDLRSKVRPAVTKAIAAELKSKWNRSIEDSAKSVVSELVSHVAGEFKRETLEALK